LEGSLTYKTVDVVVAQLSHQFHFLHNIPEQGRKKTRHVLETEKHFSSVQFRGKNPVRMINLERKRESLLKEIFPGIPYPNSG
jgi:hypothetical protein